MVRTVDDSEGALTPIRDAGVDGRVGRSDVGSCRDEMLCDDDVEAVEEGCVCNGLRVSSGFGCFSRTRPLSGPVCRGNSGGRWGPKKIGSFTCDVSGDPEDMPIPPDGSAYRVVNVA